MQIDRKVLSKQIRSRLSQPCPSSLGGDDRVKWQNYRASLRHLDTQVDNHQGAIRKEHLVGFGSHLGALTQGTDSTQQSAASPAVAGGSVLANALGGSFGGSGGSVSGQSGMVDAMANRNTRFFALQNAVQQESRKYQTISSASRAAHQAASSSVNNIRA